MAENRELTLTDKKKLEEELAELIEAKKRVAEEIQVARGFGDLSENAEYDAAKKEEARVYGRIGELEQLLRTATFVDDSKVSTDIVSLGNVVRVLDMEYDEEDEYTLVGFTEADPLKLFISNESPIGEALIGAHLGDIVEANTPGGKIKLKILAIRKR
ncbi:MAG: transcription elongation factor GreA [Clostridia bacterium]|mgnify:FL=1|nr:transcription elongation factor GreA [Clostridia bacterium]